MITIAREQPSSIELGIKKIHIHHALCWKNPLWSSPGAIERSYNIICTSHANIAYGKQIPPQRTVRTIGSVWQESTPSKETTGPAKRYENEQSEMPNGARAALAWARGL